MQTDLLSLTDYALQDQQEEQSRNGDLSGAENKTKQEKRL